MTILNSSKFGKSSRRTSQRPYSNTTNMKSDFWEEDGLTLFMRNNPWLLWVRQKVKNALMFSSFSYSTDSVLTTLSSMVWAFWKEKTKRSIEVYPTWHLQAATLQRTLSQCWPFIYSAIACDIHCEESLRAFATRRRLVYSTSPVALHHLYFTKPAFFTLKKGVRYLAIFLKRPWFHIFRLSSITKLWELDSRHPTDPWWSFSTVMGSSCYGSSIFGFLPLISRTRYQ